MIVTAMVALRTLTPDAAGVFAAHVQRVADRSLGGAAPPSPDPASASDTRE